MVILFSKKLQNLDIGIIKVLCEKLSHELKNFLTDSAGSELSMYARLKIFTSAYLHMRRSYALLLGPDYSCVDQTEEIYDLWG